MTKAASLYKAVMADYDTLDVDDAKFKFLAQLAGGSWFATDSDRAIYVNNWNVNEEFIYHKHPEITGGVGTMGEPRQIEWDVRDRHCMLCGAYVPDTIWLLNKYYMF